MHTAIKKTVLSSQSLQALHPTLNSLFGCEVFSATSRRSRGTHRTKYTTFRLGVKISCEWQLWPSGYIKSPSQKWSWTGYVHRNVGHGKFVPGVLRYVDCISDSMAGRNTEFFRRKGIQDPNEWFTFDSQVGSDVHARVYKMRFWRNKFGGKFHDWSTEGFFKTSKNHPLNYSKNIPCTSLTPRLASCNYPRRRSYPLCTFPFQERYRR